MHTLTNSSYFHFWITEVYQLLPVDRLTTVKEINF